MDILKCRQWRHRDPVGQSTNMKRDLPKTWRHCIESEDLCTEWLTRKKNNWLQIELNIGRNLRVCFTFLRLRIDVKWIRIRPLCPTWKEFEDSRNVIQGSSVVQGSRPTLPPLNICKMMVGKIRFSHEVTNSCILNVFPTKDPAYRVMQNSGAPKPGWQKQFWLWALKILKFARRKI